MSGLMAVEQQIRGESPGAGARVTSAPPARVQPRRRPARNRRRHRERHSRIDGDSIRALEQIVEARRIAAQATEQGEATLAAYGRVIAFPPAATLVDRRG